MSCTRNILFIVLLASGITRGSAFATIFFPFVSDSSVGLQVCAHDGGDFHHGYPLVGGSLDIVPGDRVIESEFTFGKIGRITGPALEGTFSLKRSNATLEEHVDTSIRDTLPPLAPSLERTGHTGAVHALLRRGVDEHGAWPTIVRLSAVFIGSSDNSTIERLVNQKGPPYSISPVAEPYAAFRTSGSSVFHVLGSAVFRRPRREDKKTKDGVHAGPVGQLPGFGQGAPKLWPYLRSYMPDMSDWLRAYGGGASTKIPRVLERSGLIVLTLGQAAIRFSPDEGSDAPAHISRVSYGHRVFVLVNVTVPEEYSGGTYAALQKVQKSLVTTKQGDSASAGSRLAGIEVSAEVYAPVLQACADERCVCDDSDGSSSQWFGQLLAFFDIGHSPLPSLYDAGVPVRKKLGSVAELLEHVENVERTIMRSCRLAQLVVPVDVLVTGKGGRRASFSSTQCAHITLPSAAATVVVLEAVVLGAVVWLVIGFFFLLVFAASAVMRFVSSPITNPFLAIERVTLHVDVIYLHLPTVVRSLWQTVHRRRTADETPREHAD